MKPSRDQAINMRWILTWKTREDGTKKAKARAVLLGYQDPAYEHRATTAPVMTRQTRQLLLQLAANRGWQVQKGDVSWSIPPREGISRHPVLRAMRRDLRRDEDPSRKHHEASQSLLRIG